MNIIIIASQDKQASQGQELNQSSQNQWINSPLSMLIVHGYDIQHAAVSHTSMFRLMWGLTKGKARS
jgi:hypothetical protein